VLQVMKAPTELLEARTSVAGALEQTHASQFRAWPVMDKDLFLGMISQESLERTASGGNSGLPLMNLVQTDDSPHVHTDQPLHIALERMSKFQIDAVPVVHRADVHKLEGIVTLRDVLDSYGVDCVEQEA
jgi:CBS domain-containing protein